MSHEPFNPAFFVTAPEEHAGSRFVSSIRDDELNQVELFNDINRDILGDESHLFSETHLQTFYTQPVAQSSRSYGGDCEYIIAPENHPRQDPWSPLDIRNTGWQPDLNEDIGPWLSTYRIEPSFHSPTYDASSNSIELLSQQAQNNSRRGSVTDSLGYLQVPQNHNDHPHARVETDWPYLSIPTAINASPAVSPASLTASCSHPTIHCEECGQGFNGAYRRGNLSRHIRQRHVAPTLKCEVTGCHKDFHRMDKLRDHVRHAHKGHVTSSGRGKLKFEDCQDVSSKGPGIHRCTMCEVGPFMRRADLLRHQRTHLAESERPHRCAKCTQSFLYPKDLRRHEKTHDDTTKPVLFCPHASCSFGPGGQGFSRADNLQRHIKRAHPDVLF